MSATELIEQVKRQVSLLSPEEQRRFLVELAEWESITATATNANGQIRATDRLVQWPDPTERLRRVFGDRALAQNVVLEAREEESY